MRRMPPGDWIASLRLSGTTLGTSLVLALAFGLTSRPASGDLHWGSKTTVAWIAWIWESMFGVDALADLRVRGSAPFLNSSLDGTASAHGWIGAMPLTLTVLTLLVTALAFRRATAQAPSALAALLVGVRAAILTTVVLTAVAALISLDAHDVTGLAPDHLRRWASLDKSLSLSLSLTDALLVSLALQVALIAALVLLRTGWFDARGRTLQLLLATPLRACGRLSVGLVVSGLLYELVIWQVRWHTSWPGGQHRPSLTPHQWVNAFSAAIAYSGNAGAMALGLGSFGQVGISASGRATTASFSQSASFHDEHWIGWFAESGHLSYGVWSALLIAPVLLAVVAWPLVRVHREDPRASVTELGIWLVSLVAVVPALAALASLTSGGSGTANATLGTVDLNGAAAGSADLGMSTLVTTFAVFVAALIVGSALSAFVLLRRGRSAATGTALVSSRS